MTNQSHMRKILTGVFFLLLLNSTNNSLYGQNDIRHYAMFSGPNGAGTSLIGSSITINNGSVGAYKLVQTTGNATINANIHSGDKVIITNSNVISGRITAGNSSGSTGNILTVGSSTFISGNIDVNGNIQIGGGTVSGTVTLPPGKTYVGPVPAGDTVFAAPTIPTLPAMPAATVYPAPPPGYTINSYTTTQKLSPGWYGTVNYSGNKTLTLDGPGVYVFNSFQWSGNSNKLVFDFKGSTGGQFYIYVINNADFGKLNASLTNGGSASRIFLETHGNGTGTSINGYSFIIANGSSGGGSKWQGTVYATNSGINIGSGTGSSNLSGALHSSTQVTIQSGVTLNYFPFIDCIPPEVRVTSDRPLNFLGETTLTDSVNTGGVTRLWQASNGGVISSDPTARTITVAAAGTYVLTVAASETCKSKDTVIVSAKIKNIIGAELLSIYQNYDPNNPNPELDSFFVTNNGYVTIDIICKVDTQTVINLLTQPGYGLINIIPNGLSKHTVTGDIPVVNLLKLNDLASVLNFCRPYYRPSTNAGIVVTQGDTTARTYLVRKGFDIDGSGVKIGVISDSYKTITDPSKSYADPCAGINQTNLHVNTEAVGVSEGDLSNVTVLLDFPIKRSDEGRAMMEIINDIAPGSQKYFRTGFFTAGDFAKAIEELAAVGCKIIVDDVSYFTEPMLKDGVVAKTVNKVKQENGVVYVSAAGNFGKKSYEKNFNPVDATNIGFTGKKAHNFGSDNANPDFFQKVMLRPGNYMFVMQWVDDIYSADEIGGTKFDIDFYLTKKTDGTGLIAFNRDNEFGDPIEFIPIRIEGSNACDTVAREYNILIVNNTITGDPGRIKYVVYQGNIRIAEYNEGNSTIVGQAGAEGAIAVGASRFNHFPRHPLLSPDLLNITKPQIEPFSSIGGTLVNGASAARLKPDLVGPDGVNTTVLMGQDYPNQALDGFSNFFGTSAAAPHVAATTALLIQARQKFLNKNTHPVDSLKLLLQSTAVDMRLPEMGTNDYNFFTKTGTYDYVSGAGMVDADSAMRTFATPRPFEIRLEKPTNIIPCQDPFVLRIIGENFSASSKVYLVEGPGDSTLIIPTYISKDTILVTITSCVGNPEILVYSPPRPPVTEFDDGGFSNSIKLFSKEIVIQTLNVSKKYGEVNPTPLTTITVDGIPIAQSGLTPAGVGLDPSKLNLVTTNATKYSNVGTYAIKVYREFSNTNSQDLSLTNLYRYVFKTGLLTIDKLPVTVVPNNKTIVYGHAVGNITYKYKYGNGTFVSDPILLNKFDSSYKVYKPDNAIAVISNYPGSTGLTDASLVDLSGMTTFQALKNSRKFEVINGILTPLPANSTLFNIQYLVDVSAQSLLNYKTNPASVVFVPAYPGIHSRAMISAGKLAAGEVNTTANPLGQMINGLLVKSVNTSAGSLVPIYTNNLMQMVDGVQVTVNGTDTSAIPNASLVQVANGLLVKSVNGELVPLENNVLVKLANNTIVYQTTSGLLVKSVNGTDQPVLNGLLVKSVNGLLVKSVNGVDVPVENNTLIQMTNGLLVKSVNNVLLQMTSSAQIPVANTDVQIVNGRLVQSVNNTNVPLTSGLLVKSVNGDITQVVNSFSVSDGDNEDAAIIIDSDDINVESGYLGGLFSIDMITGLTIGNHKLIAGTLINPNLKITYDAGNATVVEDSACLLTHSPFKNFGNTTQQPTSLWLNLTTKVSGQLTAEGDYLLFKSASVTFNSIASTPLVTNLAMPNGKILATSAVTVPVTQYDALTNTWTTRVPIGYASTSDIFVTGVIINSSNGFVKMNGNTSSVVKGMFYSNKNFTDQWGYGIAAYQPQFTYASIAGVGQVISINGNYRAGTPTVGGVPVQTLVQGASGGGGNNYTGSTSSFQTYTACIDQNPLPTIRITNSSLTFEAGQQIPAEAEVLIRPNPASGHITISFVTTKTGSSKIEIFTINGRKVLETGYGTCEAGNSYVKQVDVSKLINGIYLVRLWNAGSVTNKKIVIAH